MEKNWLKILFRSNYLKKKKKEGQKIGHRLKNYVGENNMYRTISKSNTGTVLNRFIGNVNIARGCIAFPSSMFSALSFPFLLQTPNILSITNYNTAATHK